MNTVILYVMHLVTNANGMPLGVDSMLVSGPLTAAQCATAAAPLDGTDYIATCRADIPFIIEEVQRFQCKRAPDADTVSDVVTLNAYACNAD